MPLSCLVFVVYLLMAPAAVSGARVLGPLRDSAQSVRDCDAALMEKLKSVHSKGYAYIQAFRLKKEIGCYQRAPSYTDAIEGPKSAEEFQSRMRSFAQAMIDSPNAEAFARLEDTERLWPYFDNDTLSDHKDQIKRVAGRWDREIEYVPYSRWREYQDVMWLKFLRAFEGPEKKKIVVAINVADGGGGDTTLCNACKGCFVMFCKSTLWSLVQLWNHFFSIPRRFGFMQGVDLFFYDQHAHALPASRDDTTTVVLHLQDASYSGDQISILTNKLQSDGEHRAVQVGLIVIGKRYSDAERPGRAEEYKTPCSLTAERCFIFGKEAETELSPRSCVPSAPGFDHGAHFIVQHKAADDISLGDCWHWYQFLGLRTPYNQDHSTLPVAPESASAAGVKVQGDKRKQDVDEDAARAKRRATAPAARRPL
eukprot:TRINITY_DN45820_c0_g1_i1.p1 TRINITY_DN45820_c0_g1~~TRINITY_DN45820_c0_g1_i1.p1  ORF type:complete len:424 (+),score=84.05 TRINITY_DN45820_c0_g1_i1:47-1318(+)